MHILVSSRFHVLLKANVFLISLFFSTRRVSPVVFCSWKDRAISLENEIVVLAYSHQPPIKTIDYTERCAYYTLYTRPSNRITA